MAENNNDIDNASGTQPINQTSQLW